MHLHCLSIVQLQDAAVAMLDFGGAVVREWRLSRPLQSLVACGGADQQDALLVSQQGGQILKLDINNSAAVPLLIHPSDIR